MVFQGLNLLIFVELFLICLTALLVVRIIRLRKKYQTKQVITFVLLLLAAIAWMVSAFLFNFIHLLEYKHAILVAKSGWVWPPVILALLYYYFTLTFYKEKGRITRFSILLGACVLSVLSLVTDFTIGSVSLDTIKINYGSGYIVSVLFIVIVIFAIFITNTQIKEELGPKDLIKLNYLNLGYQTTIFLAICGNILVPLIFQTSKYSHLAIISIIPTIFVSYYILVEDKFYDIKLLRARGKAFLKFNLFISLAFYQLLFLGVLANKNFFGFDVFLYGQIIVVALFFIFNEFVYGPIWKDKHEGFYRYTLLRSGKGDTLRIQYLLRTFGNFLLEKYNVDKVYLTVALLDRKKHFVVGKKIEGIYLYKKSYLINKNSSHIFEIEAYSKLDGFDLSVQEIENILLDLKELLHLIFQSVLYEESLNFSAVLQEKVKVATGKLRLQKKAIQDKLQYEKDMMGIMGHELRTPMTVAKGMAELVLNKLENNECNPDYIKEKTHKIHDSILKESELIQTMLSTSHVDNGQINFQILPVNIIDVIEYSISAFEKDAATKGLKLEFIKPATDELLIQSDPNRVQEIINNLVSNGVKYTNKGYVKVYIEQKPDSVIIHVEDSGIGIPKSEQENIGKKFYRIHQHLDKYKDIVRAGGTGLGLYVVRGVLKALGGELIVKSEAGKGSTFSAVFPKTPDLGEKALVTEKPVDKHDMFQQLGMKK